MWPVVATALALVRGSLLGVAERRVIAGVWPTRSAGHRYWWE
jgi:hypothetical protein